ncbi:putative type IV pilin [Gottschalkia acidurici 9a]|uniref:Type IV pilin n=2 Tax=Clostridium acidurici TaxID=1556 RepID=K0AX41_GOTA9|nr:putative type IV pilin [Gottschalkia acidurici 9a]
MFVKSRVEQFRQDQNGFTLVELIVVVAILGILAAIGVSRFAGMTDKAREKADLSTAATIASATQAWISDQDKKVESSDIGINFITNELVAKGYIESPKNSQTNGETWVVLYDDSTHELIVKAGTNEWYPKKE